MVICLLQELIAWRYTVGNTDRAYSWTTCRLHVDRRVHDGTSAGRTCELNIKSDVPHELEQSAGAVSPIQSRLLPDIQSRLLLDIAMHRNIARKDLGTYGT